MDIIARVRLMEIKVRFAGNGNLHSPAGPIGIFRDRVDIKHSVSGGTLQRHRPGGKAPGDILEGLNVIFMVRWIIGR